MPSVDELHTWVINLDRAPERLQRIAGQLQRCGLAWTRLSAVDGRTLDDAQRGALDVPAYRRRHGMDPVSGELGCYLSHLAAMRAFLDSSSRFALVLEDDALLTADLPAVLQALLAHAARWDMVKLSAVHSGTPQPVLALRPGHDLSVMLSRCTGASAYLVNRHAAAAYLEKLLPMSLPWDHVFDQGWRLGLKVRRVVPAPCVHDAQIATTIPTPGPSRKFAWPRRLPAFGYRLSNEWRRLLYGLGETRRERQRPA